ncbi:MAG: DUF2148 domain-containing protein [Atribacterota bacterium]|nr:DUF2148 domain-containing protein [Atribacterota bacterium]MDD4895940.1 DUF2148 domain-containing protein [Atribacterota bacterium]MDD5637393.1 DUF2148 domain-containing protein [Atribacterota bacterium]
MNKELGFVNPEEVLKNAVELMALSARTAPKAAGKDFVVIKVISGDEVIRLGEAMIHYGIEQNKRNFDRDGENVKNSPVVLLIGLKDSQTLGLDCGACGFDQCSKCQTHKGPEFDGPQCALHILDMGIAIGSAVKAAAILGIDNRIMYRIGVVAKKAGFIEASFVMGIPFSVTGKNIYFDR